MMWLILALGSAILSGASFVMNRAINLEEDTMSYSFVLHVIASLFYIPFLIAEFSLPKGWIPWALALFASVLWAIVAYFGFKSHKYTEASLKAPIGQSKLIWVLLFSLLFLGEALTSEKIVGTLVVFAGVVILTYHKRKMFGKISDPGIQLTLLTSFVYAAVTIVDKVALSYFKAGTYGFLMYFVPAMMFIPFLGNKGIHLKKLIKGKWIMVLITAALCVSFYQLNLMALNLADVSLVFPITNLGILFSSFGSIIFLKEKKEIAKRIISAVIVIIGAFLLSGYYNIF